tara:strand:- start:4599 stop:4943 length:345 start_codon:yes stop_codon:yes gene_type:complete
MNESLKAKVIKQLGLEDSLRDVREHGADAGFSGFTYYSETCKFALDNLKDIRNEIRLEADALGYSSAAEMVAGFGCLCGSYSEDECAEVLYGQSDDTYILNALAWYALELAAGS